MDSSTRGDSRRSLTGHPDVLELVAFARDELDRSAADRILEHCRSCPDCGDDLAATILLTSLSPRRRPAPWRRYATVAAAAVLVLATGVCFTVWQGRLPEATTVGTGPGAGTLTDAPAGTPDAEAELRRRMDAAASLPETTVDRLGDLATTEPIPGRFHAMWFDHPRPVATGDAEVGPGARRIVEGRYHEAVALLEESRRVAPESPEVQGMLGVARYLAGDHSDATLDLLRSGVDARSYGTWVQWYLANAYLARGEIGRSADTLARLARRHEAAARRAQALLSRFPDQLR